MKTLAGRLCRLNELMGDGHLAQCLSHSKDPRLLLSPARRTLLIISIGLHKNAVENCMSRLHRLLLTRSVPATQAVLAVAQAPDSGPWRPSPDVFAPASPSLPSLQCKPCPSACDSLPLTPLSALNWSHVNVLSNN